MWFSTNELTVRIGDIHIDDNGSLEIMADSEYGKTARTIVQNYYQYELLISMAPDVVYVFSQYAYTFLLQNG